MEDDRSIKQEYLKYEIVNGGLDQNKFVAFLNTLKGEGQGANVDNWELQELRDVSVSVISFQVVDNFKARCQEVEDVVVNEIQSKFQSAKL